MNKRHFFLRIMILLLIAIYACPSVVHLAHRIIRNTGQFLSLNTDYERLYAASALYRKTNDAARMVPSYSHVQLAPPDDQFSFDHIVIRYHLYPRLVVPQGNYIINLEGAYPPPPSGWQTRATPSGVHVHAAPGHPWGTEDRRHGLLMGIPLVLFTAFSLWLIWLGSTILKAIGVPRQEGLRGWFFSTAYLLGLLLTGGLMWAAGMAGLPFHPIILASVMTILTALAFLCHRLHGEKSPLLIPLPVPPPPRSSRGIIRIGNIIAVTTIAAFVAVIISIPVSVWDEMFIWIIKARHFYHLQALDLSYTVPTNTYYPLLWPIHIGIHFLLTGDADELSKWIAALVFCCFLLQIRGGLFLMGVPRPYGWIAAAAVPIVFYHWSYYSALPEVLFLSYLTAMMVFVLMSLHASTASPVLLGCACLMGAGLTMVKFEGAAATVLCALALLLASRCPGHTRSAFAAAAGMLCLMLLPIAWAQWVEARGYTVNMYHLNGNGSMDYIRMIFTIISSIGMENRFYLLAGAGAFILMMGKTRRFDRKDIYLLCMAFGLAGTAAMAGLNWPANDVQKYYPEAFTRLLLHAAPAVALLSAGRAFKPN